MYASEPVKLAQSSISFSYILFFCVHLQVFRQVFFRNLLQLNSGIGTSPLRISCGNSFSFPFTDMSILTIVSTFI